VEGVICGAFWVLLIRINLPIGVELINSRSWFGLINGHKTNVPQVYRRFSRSSVVTIICYLAFIMKDVMTSRQGTPLHFVPYMRNQVSSHGTVIKCRTRTLDI